MKGYFYGIISVVLITFAQLCLKAGVSLLPSFKLDYQLLNINWLFKNYQGCKLIFIGLICYIISMFFWLFALKFLALSKAYSLIGLSYVLVYLLAIILPWFNESATLIKFIGIIFIIVGIWIISKSKTEE